MKRSFFRLISFASSLAIIFSLVPGVSKAQSGNQGTVAITVQDADGALIPGAQLKLIERRSNSPRQAATDSKGIYSFVNLSIGSYKLTISHDGYQTKIYDDVVVQSSTTTPLNVVLPVGAVSETVNVTTQATAVLQTSSTEIGTVLNTNEIENLPIIGRSVATFGTLVAGYNGTYNGIPSPNQGNNIDGMISSNSRMKFSGNTNPSVSPRVESFEQMSVVSDGLNLGNGFGQASTQLNFVTRRGSNQFHGRMYYDFRNSGLNANAWANKVGATQIRRPKYILHDFGITAGGPILRDKLFFFGTFAEQRQPTQSTSSSTVITQAAQAGNFTYTDLAGTTRTVNVYQLAQNYNANTGSSISTTPNAAVAAQLALINKAPATAYINTSDPNLQTYNAYGPGGVTNYFPTARFDYNLSDKVRMYLSGLMSQYTTLGAYPAPYQSSDFANQNAYNFTRNYTASYGLDYIISPRVINQFKFGFLYTYTLNATGSTPNWLSHDVITWAYGTSGQNYTLPTGNFYPTFSLSDNVTYQRGAHNFNFGFQGYREQDHYYNPPVGFNIIALGMNNLDPAVNAFTYCNGTTASTCTNNPSLPFANSTTAANAQALYATLTGRINSVNGSHSYDTNAQKYSSGYLGFNLNEVNLATGIWLQDSWKMFPTLTLNYGLRWDFTTPSHDKTAQYHNSTPQDIYGPTALSDLFKPGTLNGIQNPGYQVNPRPIHGWYVSPQPQFSLAWNPKDNGRFLDKVLGNGATVIRAGFGLRNFTEPYQYFWDAATNYGSFFYQFFNSVANTTGATGTYTPGSLALQNQAINTFGNNSAGNPICCQYSPTSFQQYTSQASLTYNGGSGGTQVSGINPNIKQPYTESWNLGIQRALSRTQVIEIRYNGNHTVHTWIQINPNEVNVFENGFLAEFNRARANLAANGGKSFADVNNNTPIIDAAFAGTSNFTNATFINYLNNGQVGTFANQLAGNNANTPQFFCKLVGTKFSPCATYGGSGLTANGYGLPINFFQANPYSGGRATNYMDSIGYANYNGLQIDLRQASWHGLQGDINYTWSHSLGLGSNNGYDASIYNYYTLRDLRTMYGPSIYDIQSVMHAYGTYDLPFGKGKAFANHNALLDRLVGGFNVGTIVTIQSGAPFRVAGGFATFNSQADGGVNLIGVTSKQLQQSVGITRIPGQSTAYGIDPKYIASNGQTANTAYMTPNTTPGTIANVIYLHGPRYFTQNISVTKNFPIKDQINFNVQGEFINAWNHTTFGTPAINSSIQSTTFARSSPNNIAQSGFGRVIELRANITF